MEEDTFFHSVTNTRHIALVNELSLIFDRVGIDTEEVLIAAGTKWNFIPMKPGLVGGHCIGVDPYYLAHKAIEVNYYPELILAGRKLNNKMGKYAALTAAGTFLILNPLKSQAQSFDPGGNDDFS